MCTFYMHFDLIMLHIFFFVVVILQDVWKKLIKKEGFFSLWKGFTPYYARLGPHTVLTFIFLEQLRKLYYNHVHLGVAQ